MTDTVADPDLEERQRELRRIADSYGSQTAFAEAIGWTQSRVSRALGDDTLSETRITTLEAAIAKAHRQQGTGNAPTQADRSSSYVRVTGKAHPSASAKVEGLSILSNEQLRDMGLARIQRIAVTAGDGREIEYQLEEFDGAEILPAYYIRAHYGVEPHRLKKLKIIGDSMLGTLSPGDECLAILREGEPLKDGAIYVIWSATGAQVKRLRFDRDEEGEHYIWIWSDNPDGGRYRIRLERFQADYHVIAWVLKRDEYL